MLARMKLEDKGICRHGRNTRKSYSKIVQVIFCPTVLSNLPDSPPIIVSQSEFQNVLDQFLNVPTVLWS